MAVIERATTVNVRGKAHSPIMSDIRGEAYKEALSGPVRTFHISELGAEYMAQLEEKLKGKTPQRRPKGIDRNEVLRLVIDEQLTIAKAAQRLGISSTTVVHHLKQAVLTGQAQYLGGGRYARPKAVNSTPTAPPAPEEAPTPEVISAPTPQVEERPETVAKQETPKAQLPPEQPAPDLQLLQRQIDILARAVDELWRRVERLEYGSDFADQISDIKRELTRIQQDIERVNTTERFLSIIERLLNRADGEVIPRAG